MRSLTSGRSDRFMLISSERVFYAGLHGKPTVRALGALAICVPLHGTARLEVAGQAPRVSEILAVPAYLPHTITSESREILGLLIEPESVCDADLAEIIRQCNDPVGAGQLAARFREVYATMALSGTNGFTSADFDQIFLNRRLRPRDLDARISSYELAARMQLPIIALIDTPGAYPGIDAEERGQAEAIAKNLEVMAGLGVPIIATVIGEGGSGGALALGVADRILMLEYAIYSVISPEGCASILWRDPAMIGEAATQLKLTAPDLVQLGVCDEIIPEASGGAHRNAAQTAAKLRTALKRHLHELTQLSSEELIEQRYQKFRKIGAFIEQPA